MRSISFTASLRRAALAAVAALSVTALGGVRTSAATIPNGAEVAFTSSVITTPAPSSTFSQPAGGDGWTVAFYGGNVYTVFHHNSILKVVCLVIATAASCTDYPKTVQTLDGPPHDFGTSEFANVHIDTASATLYVWGTDRTTLEAGVVAVDLNSSNSNPFKSFTPLTAAGDAQAGPGPKSNIGNAVLIGNKWYAFSLHAPSSNYTPTGTQDKLMCFDVSTAAACPSQPFAIPGLTSVWYIYYPGVLTQIGSRLILELLENGSYTAGHYYCIDTATMGACSGNWPRASFADSLGTGGGFPALDANGNQIGVCMKITDQSYTDGNFPGNIKCIDKKGADLTAQSTAVGAVIDANVFNAYNNYKVIGTRVYLPGGNDFKGYGNYYSRMMCFDWATGQSCQNFPVLWTGYSEVSQLYTVATDPSNASCLWLMSHIGSKQVQTMDAYTAGACGVGGTRVLMSSLVQPFSTCVPTSYTSLTVTSPLPSAYSGGTVTFLDQNGATLNSLPAQNIDSSGKVDLTSLNLSTSGGLPQMLVNLPGAESADINMTVRWNGGYHPECDDGGQTVSYTPPASTTSTTVAGPGGSLIAETGSNSNSLAVFALACLAVGVTLVTTRRMRKSAPHTN